MLILPTQEVESVISTGDFLLDMCLERWNVYLCWSNNNLITPAH